MLRGGNSNAQISLTGQGSSGRHDSWRQEMDLWLPWSAPFIDRLDIQGELSWLTQGSEPRAAPETRGSEPQCPGVVYTEPLEALRLKHHDCSGSLSSSTDPARLIQACQNRLFMTHLDR